MTKEEVIKLYNMQPLNIEGGLWAAMFRSDETIPEEMIPGRKGSHSLYGSILYLLTKDSVSRMHRLASDEIWHFYMGAGCELLVLKPDGDAYTEKLGSNLSVGEVVTTMVPRGCWQGLRISGDGEWALLGTTMSPAYENCDYEDGTDALLDKYPSYAALIKPLLARPVI